jgi:hypothetical protein
MLKALRVKMGIVRSDKKCSDCASNDVSNPRTPSGHLPGLHPCRRMTLTHSRPEVTFMGSTSAGFHLPRGSRPLRGQNWTDRETRYS